MSVYIKQGVMGSYSRPIAWAIEKIHKLCIDNCADMYITSIREGNHSAGSLHYIGDAIDWRTSRGVRVVTLEEIRICLSEGRFANQFDVVDGYDDGHFHVEYDPKEV